MEVYVQLICLWTIAQRVVYCLFRLVVLKMSAASSRRFTAKFWM